MTYLESINYLNNIEKEAYVPSHQNSLNLMAALGNPQDTLPVIHLTGTNGKGSTLTFLQHILTSAGYKVASFMSPHIFSYREIIHTHYGIISEEDFAYATEQVEFACTKLVKSGLPHPTIFECLVGIAMVHFHIHTHDFFLVEVGLGGKEDATNIFKSPQLTIITSISLDHEAWLGHSLEAIALHKAGIIRSSAPIILAPNTVEVVQVISQKAKEVSTHLYLLDDALIHSTTLFTQAGHKVFHLSTPFFGYKGLHTSMLGSHQITNMATALLAIEHLKKTYPIPLSAIKAGIQSTSLPCRNELISLNPPILIDGGHNPAGLTALSHLITTHYSHYKIITVLGILRDKAYDSILSTVANFSDTLIFTQPDSPRALLISSLHPSDTLTFTPFPDYKEALLEGLKHSSPETLLVITGSLYLTCPARKWLKTHLEL